MPSEGIVEFGRKKMSTHTTPRIGGLGGLMNKIKQMKPNQKMRVIFLMCFIPHFFRLANNGESLITKNECLVLASSTSGTKVQFC